MPYEEAPLTTVRRSSQRDSATIARNGLRTVILVLFAVFFAVPLVWLLLATTKNGEQLHVGAVRSWPWELSSRFCPCCSCSLSPSDTSRQV
jgi:ABC-type glycerol-3-phosphate transport system permease component